jgi:amidase
MRVAVCLDNGIAAPTTEVRAATERAAAALERLGARVVEARPAGFEQSLQLLLELFAADGGALVRATLARSGTETIHPLLEAAFELGAPLAADGPGVAERAWRLDEHRRLAMAFWDEHDLLLSPAVAEPAVPHGTSWERLPSFSWAVAHNLTGWPAASVPGAFSEEGLPIGVHVAAAPWREDRVLAAACAIEAALGGWRPSPLFPLETQATA